MITPQRARELLAKYGSQRKAAAGGKISLGALQRALRREPVKLEPRGRIEAKGELVMELPPVGMINRYILTSAQNDTRIAEPTWRALHNLMRHWLNTEARVHRVELMVSRFCYRNFQSEDKAGWSAGRKPAGHRIQWDPALTPYLVDHRVRLARKLVFCGEMNLSPTARHPMSTLEAYNGSSSAIFPHTRVAMRSEPSVGFEGAKLLHTTGAITQRNYIQRKAGLQAEFHHCYGGALVEVDHEGNFWIRQLNATEDGEIFDLGTRATPEGVTTGHRPAVAYLGDLHPEELDADNFACTLNMLQELQPQAAFIGDVMTVGPSHHNRGSHLRRYALRECGDNKLLMGAKKARFELARIAAALRPDAILHICRSNHDDHLLRWLTEEDGFRDAVNAKIWHQLNLALIDHIEKVGGRADWEKTVNPVKLAIDLAGGLNPERFRWLELDEVVRIGGVNNAAHGHAGPRGAKGNPEQFAKLGMKANYGHIHSPGIWDGAYFAGTQGRHLYYKGPSGSACANIIQHESGKRQILVNWRHRWRA